MKNRRGSLRACWIAIWMARTGLHPADGRPVKFGHRVGQGKLLADYAARSNRSAFMTLVQTATKSRANFCLESSVA